MFAIHVRLRGTNDDWEMMNMFFPDYQYARAMGSALYPLGLLPSPCVFEWRVVKVESANEFCLN